MTSRKRNIITGISIFNMVLLLFVSYISNNNPFPFFDDIDHYAWLEYAKRGLHIGDVDSLSDVVFINVAYDKTLIPVNDEWGMPKGNTDITDRRKIIALLDKLKQNPNYKYIFLDVRFEKGYDDSEPFSDTDSTTVDKVLAKTINTMPKMIFAHHSDLELMDSTMIGKAGYSNYRATITATNFVRYPYIQDGNKSAPLRIYNDIAKHDIEQHSFYFLDNGRLCHNCPFFRISRDFPAEYDADGNKQYLNLGADILDNDLDISDMTKGKYVFIGNLTEDVHDTYVGMQPGTYISYLAYKNLVNGDHLVKWWAVVIMGILYFLLSLYLCSTKSLMQSLPYLRDIKSRLVLFLLSFIGITFFINLTTDSIYMFSGQTFTIWFTVIYFTIFKELVNIRRK